jgi:CheY-like chemotaxis protein
VATARVLVVEDEFLIRLIVAETLGDAGFQVEEASTAEEAMRVLRMSDRFDLLLTDIHMPGRFNGIDVARHARELHPDIPVVFLTGRSDALRAYGELGPRDALVQKPYGPEEVLTVVRAMLAANH